MNFGQNLYNWFLSNAQSLVLMAIVVIGIYLGFKREFSKLIGFLAVASFFGQTVCQPVKYTWQSRQLFHLKRRTGNQIIIVAFFNSPFPKLHLR